MTGYVTANEVLGVNKAVTGDGKCLGLVGDRSSRTEMNSMTDLQRNINC